MSRTVCSACNGTGHDKASRPVVKFEKREQQEFNNDGEVVIREYREHVTEALGSGCLNCCGLGVK